MFPQKTTGLPEWSYSEDIWNKVNKIVGDLVDDNGDLVEDSGDNADVDSDVIINVQPSESQTVFDNGRFDFDADLSNTIEDYKGRHK